jgi:hypothetical protein
MYYVTTKANVLPFALLGEHASRADARQMAKELGGTCRTQAEYDELVALHAVKADVVHESTAERPCKLVWHIADVVHESTAERPCKLVWHIADEMVAANPAVRRKDVLAACVARGVAFYTARTQYQQWLGIQKEMAAREAAQATK